jgi:LacI family transcriptional regulator
LLFDLHDRGYKEAGHAHGCADSASQPEPGAYADDAAQHDMMLYTTHRRRAREAAYVTEITRGMADGLLLVLPRNPEAYLQLLSRQRFPYVLIDHQGIGEGGAAVGATNRRGGYDATRHLLGLSHRRIGLITGVMDLGCAVDRLFG